MNQEKIALKLCPLNSLTKNIIMKNNTEPQTTEPKIKYNHRVENKVIEKTLRNCSRIKKGEDNPEQSHITVSHCGKQMKIERNNPTE